MKAWNHYLIRGGLYLISQRIRFHLQPWASHMVGFCLQLRRAMTA